jgi:hypothetical protein
MRGAGLQRFHGKTSTRTRAHQGRDLGPAEWTHDDRGPSIIACSDVPWPLLLADYSVGLF